MKQIGQSKVLSELLSESQKNAVIAAEGIKIKHFKRVEMVTPLKNILQSAYVTIGQGGSLSQGALTILTDEFLNELKNYFAFFSIEEVASAIDHGVKGKLNDLTKISKPEISITNLGIWCRLYGELIRRNALHEQRLFEEREEKKYNAKREEHAANEFEDEINKIYRDYYNDPCSIDTITIGLRAVYFEAIDKRIRLQTGGRMESGKAVGGNSIVSIIQKNKIKVAAELKFPSYERLGVLDQKILEDATQRQKFESVRNYEIIQYCYSESLQVMLESLKYIIGDGNLIEK